MRMIPSCMRGVRISAGMLLLLGVSSMQPAHADTVLAETPATTSYRFSSHPMIAGTVFSVDDHQMVVDTEQGERVKLQMDSRTMAPRDLAPGMEVRTDFAALDDCRFLAQRVTVVREGMSGERRQGYAVTTDSPGAMTAAYAANPSPRPSEKSHLETWSPGTSIHATPGTAAYRFATTPMISGTVIAVNDHRMVVESEQGVQISMVLDSRTMVPAELEPVSYVRAEFKEMKDGRYYATRIHLVREPASGREQAYAHTRNGDFQLAAMNDPCAPEFAAPSEATTTAYEQDYGSHADAMPASSDHSQDQQGSGAMSPSDQPNDGNTGVREEHQDHDRMPESLPQTDSKQSMVLLLGLGALVSAALVKVLRAPRKI